MNSNQRRTSRGFAMVMAIILIGLVSTGLAIMSAVFSHSYKRTQEVRTEAQLRQLLVAGAKSVEDRAANWPANAGKQDWKLELPKALAEEGAAVAVRIEPAAPALAATVEAQLEKHKARQTLTLRQVDGRWRIIQARLDQ